MKLLFVLTVLVGVTCGHHLQRQIILPTTTTLVRTPQYDSAIVQNERIGGSFSYSTIEGHAYENIVPLVRTEYRYINPIPLAFNYQIPKVYVSPIQTVQAIEPSPSLKPVGAAAMAPAAEIQRIEKEVEKQADLANDDDTVAVEAA